MTKDNIIFKPFMVVPSSVKIILDRLRNNGYEAYVVGGSVRDAKIGTSVPEDYDITTNALPQVVIKLFDKTVPTGLKHGTVTVMICGDGYEVTTYRIDGEYLDNRRPSGVTFVSDLKEDLARRDFTINALAFNEQDGLVDYFGGIKDLENKIVRAVGEPNKRFQEDALRMLRAIRFSARLNFDIEEKTMLAIKSNYNLIANISNERIRDELCKILTTNNTTKALKLLEETKLLEIILPELQLEVGFNQRNPHHDKDIFNHTLAVVEECPQRLNVRVAGLLHDIAKPSCFTVDAAGIGHFYGHDKRGAILSRKILTRLRFDNQSIDDISTLVREHMNVLNKPTESSVKRLINRVGEDLIGDLFDLQRADSLGSLFTKVGPGICDRVKEIDKVKEKAKVILESKVPLSIKELAVNGRDLINGFSLKPGEEIGDMLKFLLEKVLENPELNNKEKLFCILHDEYLKN